MTGLILGIDLGAHGAASLMTRDGDLIEVIDLPCLPTGPSCRPAVSGVLFAETVKRWQPSAAWIEFVGPRPTDSRVAAFAFGGAKATVETTLLVLGVPVSWITPQAWKKLIGIPAGKDGVKDLARAEAIRRWPKHAAMFAKAKDDGRAESALIAVAGLLRETQGRAA